MIFLWLFTLYALSFSSEMKKTREINQVFVPLNEQGKFEATKAALLGAVLSQQGKLDAAETALRKAIRLDPQMASAHFHLGNALKRQGRFYAAENSLHEAIRLDLAKNEIHVF